MARLRLPIRTLIVCAIVIAAPRHAAADWHLTPFVGLTFKGGTTLFELEDAAHLTHWNFGAAATMIGRSPFGAEAFFVYTPGFFSRDQPLVGVTPGFARVKSSRSYALMGNAVLAAPLSWNEYGLRPFVSGGLGLLHATMIDEGDIGTFKRDMAAYNIGGGAVGFVTNRTGLRFDLRYIHSLKREADLLSTSGKRELHYWTASVGVVLKY
jgi:hypothetical protein